MARDLIRRNAAPLLILLLVALGASALGYVTAGDASIAAPAALPPLPAATTVSGIVEALDADSIRLGTDAGPKTLKLSDEAVFEALRPAALTSISAGDWLNVGVMPHAQTVFAIVGLVVIPASILEAPP